MGGTEGSHMRAESPQDMLSTFGMGAEHVERLQHVVGYRSEDETEIGYGRNEGK